MYIYFTLGSDCIYFDKWPWYGHSVQYVKVSQLALSQMQNLKRYERGNRKKEDIKTVPSSVPF